jgi:hypothetical protein
VPDTARLVMDLQRAVVARHPDLDYLPRLRTAIDGDPEVHRVLTEKVFPMQAAVISVADWRHSSAARDSRR